MAEAVATTGDDEAFREATASIESDGGGGEGDGDDDEQEKECGNCTRQTLRVLQLHARDVLTVVYLATRCLNFTYTVHVTPLIGT